ncbi:MAG TPA: FtsX-like permease family protein [Jatrophihabitantaceae bacterium]
MNWLSLLGRAALSRKGFSAAVFAVGAITMAAAAIGPLYARAARESLLTDALDSAPADQTGASYTFNTDDVAGPGAISEALRTVRGPAPPKEFASPILAVDVPGFLVSGDSRHQIQASTDLAWRADACAHLVVIGRCPARPGEVLVSQRTLDGGYGWHRGGTLRVAGENDVSMRIVGSYRPKDTADRFWFGGPYFDAHRAPPDPDVVDAVFTTQQTLESMPSLPRATISADYLLQARSVHLNDLPRIKSQVAALTQLYTGNDPEFGTSSVRFQSRIAEVFASAGRDGRKARVGSLVATVELAALAWLVLFQVMADAIEARGGEIALAKLRGLRPLDTLRFGLGEQLLPMAAAIPVALLVALAVVHLLAGHLLASGVPVVMTWSPVWALLIGFTGGCVAALLAARRVLTRPVLEQWRRTGTPPAPRFAVLALDLAVVAAAIGALIELRSGRIDRPSSLGLLAPGLLVVAAALLGTGLLGLASRALVAATDASRHLGIFLAVRQVARRRAAIRLAAISAATVGLASFALAEQAVVSANRVQRAGVEIGAPQILSVQTAPGHDPVQATHDADPHAQWAMAAARWLPDGGTVVGTVLAVDSARLPATMNRADALPAASTLQQVLTTDTLPKLSITGDAIRVRLDTRALSARQAPTVEFDLDRPGRTPLQVATEPLRRGRATYTVAVPCASQPCTLASITWERGVVDTFGASSATMLITAIDQHLPSGGWRPVPARLSDAQAWRAHAQKTYSTTRLQASAAGLQVRFADSEGESASIEYADFPRPAVAIATPSAVTSGDQAASVLLDLRPASLSYRLARSVPLLPAVVDNGFLIDLRPVLEALPEFSTGARWEVWLGPHAPPDAVTQLQRHGLLVQSEHTTGQRRAILGRQAPALALGVLLACAIAAAILCVAATATAAAASGRRRSFELAALRVLGVRRRALLRGSFLEQAVLLGAAVIIGVPGGGVAAQLTTTRIPVYSDTTPVPMTYTVHLGSIMIFAAILVVLLAATALTAAVALTRAAVPTRLREAEQ